MIRPPHSLPIEERLARPGMYLIEESDDGMLTIVHRSRTQQIHRTQVQVDAQGKLFLDRPSWEPVHMTHYDDIGALLTALRGIYLTRVG